MSTQGHHSSLSWNQHLQNAVFWDLCLQALVQTIKAGRSRCLEGPGLSWWVQWLSQAGLYTCHIQEYSPTAGGLPFSPHVEKCRVPGWWLIWHGDLPPPWAVLGRRYKLQTGLHCQGNVDHLLHKPHLQHCYEFRERILGVFFLFWSFKSIGESKFGCTMKTLGYGWLLALERFFSLKFLVLALYFSLTALPEWLSSQDELYVCLNACGFGV